MILHLALLIAALGQSPLDLANFTEDNLIDSGGAANMPSTLAFGNGKAGTVVFADEAVFDGTRYLVPHDFLSPGTQNAPSNIVVVADTIRLTSPNSVDLSAGILAGPNQTIVKQDGGTLTLIARHIVFDPHGSLSFTGFGMRGEEMATGRLRIVAKEVSMSQGKEEEAIEDYLSRSPFDLVQSSGTPISADQRTQIAELLQRSASSTQISSHNLSLLQAKSNWDDDLANLVLSSRREAARNAIRSMSWKSAVSYGVVVTPVPPLPAGLPPGTPTREIAANYECLDDIPGSSPELKTLMSAWKVRRLEALRLRMTELTANSNWAEFAEVASRISSLENVPIVQAHSDAATKALQDIQTLIDRAPVAVQQSLDLEVAPGVHQVVITLTTVGNRNVYAIPDTLMLEPLQMGGSVYSGLLRQRQDSLEVLFSGRFSLSPTKERALRKYLARRKLSYSGLATQLSMKAQPINFPGVSLASTLTVSGDSCSGSLVFSSTNSVAAMAQFAGGGIPVSFDWTTTSNGRAQGGTISGLTLSRSHVDYQALTISGEKISHILTAGHPKRFVAVPSFASIPSGEYAFFADPKPSIGPGETVALPANLAQQGAVAIPPEALTFDVGQDIEPSQAFRVLAENDLLHDVQIIDELPENDALTNSPFARLELRIGNLDANGQEIQVTYRTIGLREQIKVPMISNLAVPKTSISGAVYYLNGGHVDLKPWTATSTLIDITPDRLVTSNHN